MRSPKQPILHIPDSVKEDTIAYRGQVDKFLQGDTSPVAFRAYRVPMGIYEQRAAGKYMVRIRIGAGLVLPYQLEKIAELSRTYGNGILHVTTRQDIQIHEVDIEDTPDVLESLLEVGLSPRGGGGNTVRNITACPRAGVCPKEKFDVAPYAIATAEYLMQFKSSYNLPRKYKIVFSGCPDDCAFASVADLGFFAHQKDGAKGFAVYAGGGLGSNPAVSVKIEDFVADNEILQIAEAIKRLFDKHGDRSNKHKARLRYVVARVGAEEFANMYKKERADVDKQGLEGDVPEVRDIVFNCPMSEAAADIEHSTMSFGHNVMTEKAEGLFTVRLSLNLGDIPADDLAKVARIADEFGQGLVRTTQLQNLLITSVSQENIGEVKSALEGLSINVIGNAGPKIVACAGASTCKLGLCLSRGLAEAISHKLEQVAVSPSEPEKVIRISGCPNSCGHHFIADIGFEGRAKRLNGKLIPFYDVLLGAKTLESDARLAQKVGTVPAKAIPQLLAEALGNGGVEKEQIKDLAAHYSNVASKPLPDDYYYDFGATEPFSLAGRGPGECGAGVMDVIRVDIDEAKGAVKAAHEQTGKERSESMYRAIVAAARALLVTFGLEPKKDREILTAFSEHLIRPGWVEPQTQQLLNEAIDWRMGDKASIDGSMSQVESLTKRVEELFLSLDANLKFKIERAAQTTSAEDSESKENVIDLRGVVCPLNFVKAKLGLEKVAVGEMLQILLDEGESVRNVPESFTDQGQEVLEVKNLGDHFSVKVRRKK
jgi:sulfite reductase (ferredoxin)